MTMKERVEATMKEVNQLYPNRKPGQFIHFQRPHPIRKGEFQSFDGLLDSEGNVFAFGNKNVGTLETIVLDIEYIKKRQIIDAKDKKSQDRLSKAQERFQRNLILHENEDKDGVAY